MSVQLITREVYAHKLRLPRNPDEFYLAPVDIAMEVDCELVSFRIDYSGWLVNFKFFI